MLSVDTAQLYSYTTIYIPFLHSSHNYEEGNALGISLRPYIRYVHFCEGVSPLFLLRVLTQPNPSWYYTTGILLRLEYNTGIV